MERMKQRAADRRIIGVPWLLVRLFLGYQWINSGWQKVTSPAWVGAQAPQALHKFLTHSLSAEKTAGPNPDVFGWYADWIRAVALPNELWYSTLVAYGELLVGIALVLGLFTKWAAFLGAGMNLNYIFGGSANANGLMLAAESAMVFAGLGVSYYGVDTFLLPRLRRLFTRGRGAPAGAPRLPEARAPATGSDRPASPTRAPTNR